MNRRAISLRGYVASISLAGASILLWCAITLEIRFIDTWIVPAVVFGVLFAISEIFPIRLPGRVDSGEWTMSATFGFALLLMVPYQAALIGIAAATLFGDLLAQPRKPRVRIAFNLGQITLAFALAGMVLVVARGSTAITAGSGASIGHLLLLLPAGFVMYGINILLVSLAISIDQSAPVVTVLRADFAPFDLATHALLLSFAPVFVVLWRSSPWLTGVLLVATLATYRAMHEAIASRHESRHDELSGLGNRRLLHERIGELRAAATTDRSFAVMVMDLDGFKAINDTFGHEVGDLLLVEVAERLKRQRTLDLVARTGGDEFVIVVRDHLAPEELRAAGSHLRSLVSAPYEIQEIPLQISASVGVAVHSGDEDALDVLASADTAMYFAKGEGSGVVIADLMHDRRGPGRLQLIPDLRQAIDADELRIEYQPQVSLLTGEVVGLEALLRWDHPRHGLVAPGRFIAAAEHTELLPALTRYVFERVLRDERALRLEGFELPLSVNVSSRDLLDSRLPRDLAELLHASGVRAERVTIEVTENALFAEPERVARVLDELAASGFGLSVDDFGTGYASLSRLRDHPFTEVKIDRSFVLAMRHNQAGAKILSSVIELAHALDMDVVAEGIERSDQLSELQRLGCSRGQGYLLSPPLPVSELVPLLARGAVDVSGADRQPGRSHLTVVADNVS